MEQKRQRSSQFQSTQNEDKINFANYAVSSGSSQESPWLYYGQSNRMMRFGNNAIAVADDGSKMVVKLAVPPSSSTKITNPENLGSDDPSVMETSRETDEITEDSLESRTNLKRNLPAESHLSEVPGETLGKREDFAIYAEPYCVTGEEADKNRFWKRVIDYGIRDSKNRLEKSITSSEFSDSFEDVPTTPDFEKLETFKGNLTVILSAIYAVFIVTVGVVVSMADMMIPGTIGEIFSIYLLLLGLMWFVFLHVDLLRHCSRTKKRETRTESSNNKFKRITQATMFDIPQKSRFGLHRINYMFSKGRHSGSFFLKIGAAGFCFGHLIHSCLTLSRQILHFASHDPEIYDKCADLTSLGLHIIYPIYSFYQLYLIFKYSNVIINRFKELARFGLMHCLATSLYFWFSMILRETVDSLHHKVLQDQELHHKSSALRSIPSNEAFLPLLMNITGDKHEYAAFMDIWNNTVLEFDTCAGTNDFSALILHISPYLYPFSIEYSILVVGIWFIMWQNIGQIHHERSWNDGNPDWMEQSSLRNNLIIYADCHSANRGLFAGLLVLLATVVSIIIFFLAFTNLAHVETGLWINLVSEATLLVLMFAATLLAYRQVSQLDVNAHPISLLDDLLLFICIPCFFLYGIFSIVPAMAYANYMSILIIVLQVAQVILQTPFIIDSLRRCSNSSSLREKKPGRELITFLIVCNIAMWIIETFEIKSYETNSDRIRFYGYPLWIFLSHVTLPLTLFYRFHSSVCLVDVWKSAYEKGY